MIGVVRPSERRPLGWNPGLLTLSQRAIGRLHGTMVAVTNQSNWSAQLAAAIASQCEGEPEVHLKSADAKSADVVEVIYSLASDSSLRGVRIDAASLQSGPELLRLRIVGELAFYVLHIAMLEPRSIDEFMPPDASGVRWLPMSCWLNELYSDSDEAPVHPFARRTALRRRLPRFLLALGLAPKARDCEAVGAAHDWYNIDGKRSGCYHCQVTREGQLWRKSDQ
jgi:hypothetical protein